MKIEVNGTTYFPDAMMGTTYPTRLEMWKWRLWYRFFGHKRPAPTEHIYVIDCPFTGRRMGMMSYSAFARLKAEVEKTLA